MNLPNWRKAYPDIDWNAEYKTTNKDFLVEEDLSFDLNSEIELDNKQLEHLYLFIEKTSLSSYQLLELLADYFNLDQNRIGYAGLKDKNAITTQWFSIYLPGKFKSLDIEMLLGSQLVTAANSVKYSGQCRILEARWYSGKLRRGAITRNKFSIILRSEAEIPAAVIERLQLISERGFPNYFAKQRFGIEAQNLQLIELWIKHKTTPDPKLQSILFSAARSNLFNHILHARITAATWNKAIDGDYFILDGSRSGFDSNHQDNQISERMDKADIHPSASLYGLGGLKIIRQAGEIEAQIFEQFQSWCELLEENQLQLSHRPMRCMAQNLNWQELNATDLQLNFALPSGSYATALLNEFGEVSEFNRR